MAQWMHNRRGLLTGCVVVFSAASTGCVGSLAGDSNGGMSSVGVESINWDGTTLVIQFDPSFDEWDGWTIHHEYEEPERDRLTGGQYPRVDEPQRIPFTELLSRPIYGDVSTTTFKVTAFNGFASRWDQYPDGVTGWTEWGPSTSFDAPRYVIDEADSWSGGG